MRYPSVKTIASKLAIPTSKAKVVRGLIDGSIDPNTFAKVQAWVRQCYNMPKRSELVMCALNEVLDGHGVEAIRSEKAPWDSYWSDIVADYINMGDTYSTTVLRLRGNSFMLCSYGDFIEANDY